MRLFQFLTFGAPYLAYFESLARRAARASFATRLAALLEDRYGNSHILLPALAADPEAFVTVADDKLLQGAWAREQGMKEDSSGEDVLLAQIEHHKADVVYNLSPVQYDSRFVRRLPGCVRKTVCWRAAPVGGADLGAFDLRVSNFPPFLEEWTARGWKSAHFEPSHDPVASSCAQGERPIDVAFVGTYSRHHAGRNALLQVVARLAERHAVRFHLALARSARLVNAVPLLASLFPRLALPPSFRQVVRPPVYGLAMYRLFGSSRVVLNASIDMAGRFRGNMRCWEALGCGAVMVGEEGDYPPGMQPNEHFLTYASADEAVERIAMVLEDYPRFAAMGRAGRASVERTYSKESQWRAFRALVAAL